MCSIGHHDGPDVPARPRRRHTDGSVTRLVGRTPRKLLAGRLAEKTAQLRAEIDAEHADQLAAQHGISEQLELLPSAEALRAPLPVNGLPPAESLYWSSAREA